MGVERQGSKSGGGYVGGFFHLFDWNAKSRKKLFSGKSSLPEQSKQKKRDDGNYPTTQLHLMDHDDSLAGSSYKGSSEYSCASSVTDDDIGGSKAPGVVAKLMGLESLPTSNFSEAYSTPFSDSCSLKDAYCCKKTDEFHDDHQIMHSGNIFHKAHDPLRNNIDPKLQKTISRPFEKFQSEVLPPKSAKSIPLTHHKLLSPIKSGGFLPSKNAVHIMEAAARIIESGNQVSIKAKMPPVGSSVPLKVRDLKERAEAAKKPSKLVEASRKPVESIAAKSIKGQSMNKSWNGSLDTKTLIASSDLEECSFGSKNKGKSVSLAVQAKANVQKREGLTPNRNRRTVGQKEQGELMSNQIFKSQPSSQRSSHKKSSTNNPPCVLRQNNQKQNCIAEKEKVASKSLPSTNSQGKKVMSGDSSLGRQRSSSQNSGNSKVGSRKIGREVTDDGKELPYSSTSVTRKKRCIYGDFNFQKDQAVVNSEKKGKAIQINGAMDSKFSWAEDSKRNGMDVVSFTFTAPMGRSAPVPETSREVFEKIDAFSADFQGKKVFFNSGGTNGLRSSVGGNVIGGDALSALLEQKLRELTLGAESSRHKAGASGSTTLSFRDQTPLKTVGKSLILHVEARNTGSQTESLYERRSPVFPSTIYEGHINKHKLQEVEDMFDCGRPGSEVRNLLGCRHPSPVSILEPSIFAESCNSSNTGDSNSTEGVASSKQCSSSVQGQDVFNMRCSEKFHVMEADAELSDSASSSSTRVVATKYVTLSKTDPVGSAKWELEYVKKIICNTDMMFNDVSTGQTSEIIDPRLFDQLESHEDEVNLERKLLFDCVGECMDLRFRQYVGGGYKAWEKGLSLARRKKWLAEEVHREISSWEAMGDCMVDELVDKDMSSQCGRWLDFNVEAFELGVEIESRILNTLLNEVIYDILVL